MQSLYLFLSRRTFKKYLLIVLIPILSLSVLLIVDLMLRSQLKQQVNRGVLNEWKRIENELLTIFDESHEMMISIGKEISKNPSEDLYLIWLRLAEIFNQSDAMKRSYTWPELGWIDTSMYQHISTRIGISDPPIDLKIRGYTKTALEDPWNLHFSKPGPIVPNDGNNSWVLPFGMGITDENGKVMGVIAGCICLQDLLMKIERVIKDKSIHFALLDNQHQVFVQSFGKDLKDLQEAASHKNLLSRIPFNLVTYMDLETLQEEYRRLFIPLLLKWFLAILCIGLILCVFYYEIEYQNQQLEQTKETLEFANQLAKNAEMEKKMMMLQIRNKFKEPFIVIVTYTEILLNYLNEEIDLDLSHEKQIKFLEKIKETLLDLKKMARKSIL